MPDTSKVVINLATGLEDGERVTVALLVGGAALEQGKQVTMFLTKEAVRIALPGYADGTACDGCPPPICFNARKLSESEIAANARLGGATPLWEWIGDDHATVFSY